ncbi:MAG: hypothetical protein KDK36_14695 [Leptospiraceae bacterium]|nr:hypothetical protein [Leptospiraceae bacterium]
MSFLVELKDVELLNKLSKEELGNIIKYMGSVVGYILPVVTLDKDGVTTMIRFDSCNQTTFELGITGLVEEISKSGTLMNNTTKLQKTLIELAKRYRDKIANDFKLTVRQFLMNIEDELRDTLCEDIRGKLKVFEQIFIEAKQEVANLSGSASKLGDKLSGRDPKTKISLIPELENIELELHANNDDIDEDSKTLINNKIANPTSWLKDPKNNLSETKWEINGQETNVSRPQEHILPLMPNGFLENPFDVLPTIGDKENDKVEEWLFMVERTAIRANIKTAKILDMVFHKLRSGKLEIARKAIKIVIGMNLEPIF